MATLSATERYSFRHKRAKHCGINELQHEMERARLTADERSQVTKLWNADKKNDAKRLFIFLRSVHRKERIPQTKADAAFMLFKTGRKPIEVKKIMKETDPKMIDVWYDRYRLTH